MIMTKSIAAEVAFKGAEPLVHQQAPEIQAYGAIIGMAAAFSGNALKETVENLNQTRTVRSGGRASFSTADRGDDGRRLDAVAGSEFLDDRIRLRE